jgi:GAF domain-containing protein
MKPIVSNALEAPSRLAALDRSGLMDSPSDASFDQLAQVARFACDAPFAAISFIDCDRQWFKAQLGLDREEIPVGDSFCAHALAHPHEVMVVEDASEDPRFAANPLVTGDTHVRFYAGMPIVTADGQAIGAICIYDRQPRLLRPDQSEGLRSLAEWASALLQKRLPRPLPANSLS